MQHSPQEIKTKLGEAVDPEGNVLNMAAVVEVIGLLERTPLTKEALEQTRIGRTVNLLRKKTSNEDIARRAKRLVKKWQKLVQNHLEAVRSTNSPLNGLRCSSPVVNGLVKSDEQVDSPAETSTKLDDKGTKRKRPSVDNPSSVETQVEITNQDNTLFKETKSTSSQNNSSISNQSSLDWDEIVPECSQNIPSNISKRIKTEDVCDKRSSVGSPRLPHPNNDVSSATGTLTQTNKSDHTDVRWERKHVGQQTDDLPELENQDGVETSSNLVLDIESQANGINGRFGEDGNWYSWTETISCNEGSFIILPYVLLE